MKRIRITVRAEATMLAVVSDENFQRLVDDDATDFDPGEYDIDIDYDELINGGSIEVDDWERVDKNGRPLANSAGREVDE